MSRSPRSADPEKTRKGQRKPVGVSPQAPPQSSSGGAIEALLLGTPHSERWFQSIADSTYDWELLHLADGSIVYCSPSCERITGHPAARFLEDPEFLASMMHDDDRDAWLEHKQFATRSEHPEPSGILFRLRRPDGTVCWVEHLCQPVRSEDGQFLGTRSSNRDVTLRVLAAQREESLHRQLEERTRVLEESQIALRHTLSQLEVEKNRVRGDITSSLLEVLLPLLEQFMLHASQVELRHLELLRSTVLDLGGAFSATISTPRFGLTARELAICNMIRQGLSSKEVARFLRTSPETVRTQRKAIRTKLGLTSSRKDLALFLREVPNPVED